MADNEYSLAHDAACRGINNMWMSWGREPLPAGELHWLATAAMSAIEGAHTYCPKPEDHDSYR